MGGEWSATRHEWTVMVPLSMNVSSVNPDISKVKMVVVAGGVRVDSSRTTMACESAQLGSIPVARGETLAIKPAMIVQDRTHKIVLTALLTRNIRTDVVSRFYVAPTNTLIHQLRHVKAVTRNAPPVLALPTPALSARPDTFLMMRNA
jgi:hypothetical protein